MKQNITTFKTSLLLAGSLALAASCQDYEPFSEQQVQDRAYTREFERQFGEIDPNQNWDLFGQLARGKNAITRAGLADQITPTVIGTYTITYAENTAVAKLLPESETQIRPYKETNLGRVTQNFTTTARYFEFAPIQVWSNHPDEIGIYWYVPSDTYAGADATPILGTDGVLYFIQKAPIYTSAAHIYEDEAKTHPDNNTYLGAAFKNSGGNMTRYSDIMRVNIPDDITSYGFYVKCSAGTKYSEPKLNERLDNLKYEADEYPADYEGEAELYHDPCFVATFTYSDLAVEGEHPDEDNDQQYICFEDWMGTDCNFDMNDIIFSVKGIDPSNIIDHDAISEQAILVCEDLKSYDFDFNDIALGLNFINEGATRTYVWNSTTKQYDVTVDESTRSQKLYVTAMAAGGAYESTVTLGGMAFGEIHYLLNESDRFPNETPTAKNHHIINAGSNYEGDGLKTSFNLTSLYADKWQVGTTSTYPTYLSQLFAEGFFKISCSDGDAVTIIANRPQDNSYKEGVAPQMMLLPHYFEWPQEEKHISLAYSGENGFAAWVEDVSKTSWIFDSQDGNLVTDRGNFTPDEESSSGTVDPGQLETKHDLTVEQPLPITYGPTSYENGIFIPIDKDEVLANEGASATLKVTYTHRTQARIYLNANDDEHTEIMKDNLGLTTNEYQDPIVVTYNLTPNMFKKALDSGGIWLVSDGDERLVVSDVALLTVTGATDPDTVHTLTVSPTSMEFTTTATQSITATTDAGATITYESSNTNVATVDQNGVITPVSNGTATITVTATGGDLADRTKHVDVTVNIAHVLQVSTSSLTFGNTDAQTFTATSSTGNVSVVSSNDAVATATYDATTGLVTVTPVANGTAAITVTAFGSPWNTTSQEVSVTVDLEPENIARLTLGETGTCDEAFDSWNQDKAKYVIASTTKNLASWTNGATIQIVTSDGQNAVFKVKDLEGNIIANSVGGDYKSNKTFDLTAEQLADCNNSDGSYQFRIECSAYTSVGTATLTKK